MNGGEDLLRAQSPRWEYKTGRLKSSERSSFKRRSAATIYAFLTNLRQPFTRLATHVAVQC